MKSSLFAGSIQVNCIIIIVLGIGFFWSLAAQQIRPSLLYPFSSLICLCGLVVYFIASLIIGFVSWRKSSRWWITPALICLVFILSAPLYLRVGKVFADWEFKAHLQEYVEVVGDVKNGAVFCDTTLRIITPKVLPSNVKRIMAVRYPDGSVIVMFLVGGSFPLYHTGYLFNGCGENNSCITQYKLLENKYYLRHVIGDWYHFSG
jgi:hypothetical protein